jgi:hypothetical protein
MNWERAPAIDRELALAISRELPRAIMIGDTGSFLVIAEPRDPAA